MFLARRPSQQAIERFIRDSRDLPLSYSPIGLARTAGVPHDLDETVTVIGHGHSDFERARSALIAWKQFDIGWVELFPKDAAIQPGTVVAVLIRHLGFWSLNGARVVYGAEEHDGRFEVAYGTLTNHAEAGEEIFAVSFNPSTGDVTYRIRAVSWPRVAVTRLGYPITRMFQARFRRDSTEAMRRAAPDAGRRPWC